MQALHNVKLEYISLKRVSKRKLYIFEILIPWAIICNSFWNLGSSYPYHKIFKLKFFPVKNCSFFNFECTFSCQGVQFGCWDHAKSTPRYWKCGFSLLKCQKSLSRSWDINIFYVRDFLKTGIDFDGLLCLEIATPASTFLVITLKWIKIWKNQRYILKAEQFVFSKV